MEIATQFDCQYRKNNLCMIASRLANAPIKIPKNACGTCTKDRLPQQINNVTISIAARGVPFLREKLMVENFSASLPRGVGTELHLILEKMDFKIEKDCTCIPMIHKMNASGPDWCKKNISSITNSIIYEWERRFKNSIMPNWLLGTGCHILIDQAIENYANSLKN